MFHRVSDEQDNMWPPMPVKSFRKFMEKISGSCEIISFEDLLSDRSSTSGKPLVCISFDDGYLDFWENAMPVISHLGIPVNHNICPDLIDKQIPPWTHIISAYISSLEKSIIELPDKTMFRVNEYSPASAFVKICDLLYHTEDGIREKWINSIHSELPEGVLPAPMNWDQIKKCAESGVSIGSHSMTHRNLSRTESRELLSFEIIESKRKILEKTGYNPSVFAFPNGLYNEESMRIAFDAGYKVLLLCDDKVIIKNRIEGKRRVLLPRINISLANWREEYLRSLGLHQKLKWWLKKSPYLQEIDFF